MYENEFMFLSVLIFFLIYYFYLSTYSEVGFFFDKKTMIWVFYNFLTDNLQDRTTSVRLAST